ncbi:MAG: ABC transporter ATP-binding protein [Gemmataceae bacterium]|nr:ABC transporter ATP-binding protein [Gemmataceae bacterium]
MPNTAGPSPTSGTGPSSARADAPPGCAVESVTFGYGSTPAVRDVSFGVTAGGFLTLLGPSGCGKTTLAKLVGGYLTPAAGRVLILGKDVTALPPERRNAGMVFQSYALFPHLSARRNVSFGLEVRGLPYRTCLDRADGMLERVGLTPAERDRKPAALSGGQQQRVALARALVIQPDLLLLDEPFANLDRLLREQLRGELRRLQRENGVTTIMVTHDPEEALAVSDLVGVMNAGRLLQVGPPAEVYHRPRTPFVARALGDANLIDGADLGLSGTVMVRPERVVIGPVASGCLWHWTARAVGRSFLGPDAVVELERAGRPVLLVRVRAADLSATSDIEVGIPTDAAWVIPDTDP